MFIGFFVVSLYQIMKDILISLNNDFQEDCIFDFAELERKNKRYGHLMMKHFSENEICDGKPYTFLDYEDMEHYQLADMEEPFLSYISYKDYFLHESKWMERDSIDSVTIDELEWYEHKLDCLEEESRYMHEYKMNKIFNYIEKNY